MCSCHKLIVKYPLLHNTDKQRIINYDYKWYVESITSKMMQDILRGGGIGRGQIPGRPSLFRRQEGPVGGGSARDQPVEVVNLVPVIDRLIQT